MNRCMVAVIAFAVLVGTAPVSAADGHGGYSGGPHGGSNNSGSHGYNGHGYNGHGYNGGHGYYSGHGNYWRGYRGYYAPARYGSYYGYAPYYPYYHHNHDNSAAYLVGGLVVGSLLTNAYIHSQPAYSTQTIVQPTQVIVPAQGRHLLRDLNGDCFERTTDAAGNELRTQLPASECNW